MSSLLAIDHSTMKRERERERERELNAIPVLGESPFHFPEAMFSYRSSTNVSLPELVSGVRDVHQTK